MQTMRGQVIKVHDRKHSRNGDTYFVRVEFKMEDGSWAKTDLCSAYRNFERWEPYLFVGKELQDLILKKPGEVNADSWPEPYRPPRKGRWVETAEGMTFVEEQ